MRRLDHSILDVFAPGFLHHSGKRLTGHPDRNPAVPVNVVK
jgi:hypothetical protein